MVASSATVRMTPVIIAALVAAGAMRVAITSMLAARNRAHLDDHSCTEDVF